MAQTTKQTAELLASLWEVLWPGLSASQQERLLALPEPCHNHLVVRMRRADRAERLKAGCRRLVAMDWELFVEGLRLYPHALCRAAEAAGPLPEAEWERLQHEVQEHRLWQVEAALETRQDHFWQAVEILARHRELPQAILDYLESGRPHSEAPWAEFAASLQRFLVRARLEKVRFAAYSAAKGHG